MTFTEIRGSGVFNRVDPLKRQRILEAALEEFSANGYRNASMNTIVKRANISKGSLFHYFGAKKGLFDAIVDAALERVKLYLKDTRDKTEALDIFSRLESLLMAGFHFIDKHPQLAAIYFHALYTGQSPLGNERLRSIQLMGIRFVEGLLTEAMDKGQIGTHMDLTKVSFIINAIFERLLRSYYIEGLDPGLDLFKAKDESLKEWSALTSEILKRGLETERA
jgi:AcrR family transcriptional regulator